MNPNNKKNNINNNKKRKWYNKLNEETFEKKEENLVIKKRKFIEKEKEYEIFDQKLEEARNWWMKNSKIKEEKELNNQLLWTEKELSECQLSLEMAKKEESILLELLEKPNLTAKNKIMEGWFKVKYQVEFYQKEKQEIKERINSIEKNLEMAKICENFQKEQENLKDISVELSNLEREIDNLEKQTEVELASQKKWSFWSWNQ